MLILVTGLALFILPHFLREFGVREKLRTRLGVPLYMGLFTLATVSAIVLMVIGMGRAGFVQLWQPVYQLRYISMMAMIPACLLIVAGNVPAGFIRKELHHPMLIGVCLWGAAHLWANGDLASALLFGSLLLWAGAKIFSLSKLSSASSRPPNIFWDVISFVVGLALYSALFVGHGLLTGVQLSLS